MKSQLGDGIEKNGMVGQWLWLEYEAKIYLGPGPAHAIAIASQSRDNYLCATTIISNKQLNNLPLLFLYTYLSLSPF